MILSDIKDRYDVVVLVLFLVFFVDPFLPSRIVQALQMLRLPRKKGE